MHFFLSPLTMGCNWSREQAASGDGATKRKRRHNDDGKTFMTSHGAPAEHTSHASAGGGVYSGGGGVYSGLGGGGGYSGGGGGGGCGGGGGDGGCGGGGGDGGGGGGGGGGGDGGGGGC